MLVTEDKAIIVAEEQERLNVMNPATSLSDIAALPGANNGNNKVVIEDLSYYVHYDEAIAGGRNHKTDVSRFNFHDDVEAPMV